MSDRDDRILAIKRPAKALLWHYLVMSFAGFCAMPFVFLPLLFKYETLEYAFDQKGVRMKWGYFFRREIFLTYGRIQDIHVTSGLIERWLGLGTVAVQTASGAAGETLSIVGLHNFLEVRDFLYERMRGVKDHPASTAAASNAKVLEEIRDELVRARNAVERAP
jgi:putative membrane protein